MSKKKGKMFESKFDAEKLRELITSNCDADTIQTKLGLASKQSLRSHIMKLCHMDETYYSVKGLYVRNQSRPMINFKHELRLTKKMLSDGNFQHGDKFEIEHLDNTKIILTRIMGGASSAKTTEDEKTK